MKNHDNHSPVLIDIDDDSPSPSPADVPAIDASADLTGGQAMRTFARLSHNRPSFLMRWFLRLFIAGVSFWLSLAAWDAVTGLLARNSVLGGIALVLVGSLALILVVIAIRELSALRRLRSIETFQRRAKALALDDDLREARSLASDLATFYASREDQRWGVQRLREAQADVIDSDTLMILADDVLLSPLDQIALREVEAATRQVAIVTALVPLALADVLAALVFNLRMIRRIAEIYGGRAGTLGAWRLTRAVVSHLVATGAVAVGDDLLGSLGGGHLLSKVSRRFGEGLINGALTARVGVAAMEVCRPFPFSGKRQPKVTGIIGKSLSGLFESGRTPEN